MQTIEGFKKNKLACGNPLSNGFLSLNIGNLSEAVSYIHKLPYGRNAERDNYKLVITERLGTFSTKHAIIKALADENHVGLDLLVGVFLIDISTKYIEGLHCITS